MHTRGYLGNWTYDLLQSGGGRFTTAALAPSGDITYSWLQTAGEVLQVQEL
jgi:hypothetical protein